MMSLGVGGKRHFHGLRSLHLVPELRKVHGGRRQEGGGGTGIDVPIEVGQSEVRQLKQSSDVVRHDEVPVDEEVVELRDHSSKNLIQRQSQSNSVDTAKCARVLVNRSNVDFVNSEVGYHVINHNRSLVHNVLQSDIGGKLLGDIIDVDIPLHVQVS